MTRVSGEHVRQRCTTFVRNIYDLSISDCLLLGGLRQLDRMQLFAFPSTFLTRSDVVLIQIMSFKCKSQRLVTVKIGRMAFKEYISIDCGGQT